jgi:hypothetical protein
VGYVVAGVGVAGLIVGAVAGVLVMKKMAIVDEHCDASKQCDDEGLEATSSGKTWGMITTVGLVTGAVGVGAGTYLVLSAGSRDDRAAASVTLAGQF